MSLFLELKFSRKPLFQIPYARCHNPLLNTNHIKGQNFLKKIYLKKKKWSFKNGVKNIQAADYNGARSVLEIEHKAIIIF